MSHSVLTESREDNEGNWRTCASAFALFALLLILFCTICGQAQSFVLSFTEPPNATNVGVVHYDSWYQPLNSSDINQHVWFGQCPPGVTNIVIPDTIPNPVLLFMSASTSNQLSAYSAPIVFDTNNWNLRPPGGLQIIKVK